MIKVPKNTSSMPFQSSCGFRKTRVGLKRYYAERFGTTTFRFEKGLFAPTSLKSFWRSNIFINLLQSRLSIVSQIYTSVLKTKVKLIEYAFETLPAWTLSMPPWKARKCNQTINKVSGNLRASHNWLKTRYREKKCHVVVSRILPPRSTFLVFKKVNHREL